MSFKHFLENFNPYFSPHSEASLERFSFKLIGMNLGEKALVKLMWFKVLMGFITVSHYQPYNLHSYCHESLLNLDFEVKKGGASGEGYVTYERKRGLVDQGHKGPDIGLGAGASGSSREGKKEGAVFLQPQSITVRYLIDSNHLPLVESKYFTMTRNSMILEGGERIVPVLQKDKLIKGQIVQSDEVDTFYKITKSGIWLKYPKKDNLLPAECGSGWLSKRKEAGDGESDEWMDQDDEGRGDGASGDLFLYKTSPAKIAKQLSLLIPFNQAITRQFNPSYSILNQSQLNKLYKVIQARAYYCLYKFQKPLSLPTEAIVVVASSVEEIKELVNTTAGGDKRTILPSTMTFRVSNGATAAEALKPSTFSTTFTLDVLKPLSFFESVIELMTLRGGFKDKKCYETISTYNRLLATGSSSLSNSTLSELINFFGREKTMFEVTNFHLVSCATTLAVWLTLCDPNDVFEVSHQGRCLKAYTLNELLASSSYSGSKRMTLLATRVYNILSRFISQNFETNFRDLSEFMPKMTVTAAIMIATRMINVVK